jgi:Tol biopolymer transport system component
VPAEGRSFSASPGYRRIVWQVRDDDLPFERRMTQVWVADFDGSNPRMVADLARGGFGGWISDDVLLLSGRKSLDAQEQTYFSFSLTDNQRIELARARRLRGGLPSPDGAWLAYFVTLDEDSTQNGLWLVRNDGSERLKVARELFGAYQWRDAHRLVIIPFQPATASHSVWELDANTGKTRHLTDPDVTRFKIANGDWALSPDGRHVAFVETEDRNIWLLTLPDW